jgi:copper chaperone NosL
MNKLKIQSRLIIVFSALIMIIAFYTPIWEILMWAPQYPEGLSMQIWINNITGDVNTINGLNHYIGMKYIKIEMFPEFNYMPWILGFIILIGLATALVNRKWMLWTYFGTLVTAGIAGLVDFYLWGYDYGHNLDPTAAIKIEGMSYQPPLIGTKELLNFVAYSGPDTGGWIFAFSGILVITTLIIERKKEKQTIMKNIFLTCYITSLFLISCSTNPEPIKFGKDDCNNCKMILADNKFGAEIVTTKGKVYKFDDVNCLIKFKDNEMQNIEFAHILVIDYANPENLINAKDAFYLKSPQINSPMASNIAAFETKDEMEAVEKELGGIYMTWGELVTEYK